MDPIEAAPLLCAGITTFNALRHADAPPGAVVAIQGIGGLGHIGVQQAKQLGYRTVAIARGTDKAELAHRWAPTTTSTARRPTPARRCRNWAERP